MWHLSYKIPLECAVAVSGGADSMAALNFVRKHPKRIVTALMYDHGTGFHDVAYPVVKSFCDTLNVPLVVGTISAQRPKHLSQEEHWRNERNAFLRSFNMPVVTGHHLDDVVETWLWSCCHGDGKLIPNSSNGLIRPFLNVTKKEILDYCSQYNIPFVHDETNDDTRFMRNYIRKEMVQRALIVNPGLYKTLRKKMMLTGKAVER